MRRPWVFLALTLLLGSCGGGGSSGSGGSSGGGSTVPVASSDAARFLTQATFGPDDASISAVQSAGYAGWIDQQEATPVSSTHLSFVNNRLTQLRVSNPTAQLSTNEFEESFWAQAASAPDQLRQRVKLALSEIFVISLVDPSVDPAGAASYYDMLGANAFGNFRTLLDQVTLHPMMGNYLTSIANQPANPATGLHPDENYAREVMQLMTVGLYQLNIDGSQKLDLFGNPTATYSAADVTGLATVFTGYSWYSPTPTNTTFFGGSRDPNASTTPMIAYPAFHSLAEKDFLGVVIPVSTTANASGDLKIALDALFNHPNVGPFISKQLIQRLVTSNPSPAYVQRVATVFNNDGSGVRGNLGAVVKAILTDTEARDPTVAIGNSFGKLREPIVAMGSWMRAFKVQSTSGNWLLGSTSANTSLDQSALAAGSVFNFWRPGYSPPNTRIGLLNLVLPEYQAVDEVSVAGYNNTMLGAVTSGVGSSNDITSTYSSELAIGSDSSALMDRINLLLTYGTMSSTLRSRILTAVNTIAIPGGSATQAQINAAELNRIKLAAYMTLVSPEFLTQR